MTQLEQPAGRVEEMMEETTEAMERVLVTGAAIIAAWQTANPVNRGNVISRLMDSMAALESESEKCRSIKSSSDLQVRAAWLDEVRAVFGTAIDVLRVCGGMDGKHPTPTTEGV